MALNKMRIDLSEQDIYELNMRIGWIAVTLATAITKIASVPCRLSDKIIL